MKRNIFILLIVSSILIVFSTLIFASGTIDVKDYIKGKFPVIFNIYLAPLGELDEYEKEFIDLLQNLPEEEQKNFAKEVYNNGFSKDILEKMKKGNIVYEAESIEEYSLPQIEESVKGYQINYYLLLKKEDYPEIKVEIKNSPFQKSEFKFGVSGGNLGAMQDLKKVFKEIDIKSIDGKSLKYEWRDKRTIVVQNGKNSNFVIKYFVDGLNFGRSSGLSGMGEPDIKFVVFRAKRVFFIAGDIFILPDTDSLPSKITVGFSLPGNTQIFSSLPKEDGKFIAIPDLWGNIVYDFQKTYFTGGDVVFSLTHDTDWGDKYIYIWFDRDVVTEAWLPSYGNTPWEQAKEYMEMTERFAKYYREVVIEPLPKHIVLFTNVIPKTSIMPPVGTNTDWFHYMQIWPKYSDPEVCHHVFHQYSFFLSQSKLTFPLEHFLSEGLPTFFEQTIPSIIYEDNRYKGKLFEFFTLDQRGNNFGIRDNQYHIKYNIAAMKVFLLDKYIKEVSGNKKNLNDFVKELWDSVKENHEPEETKENQIINVFKKVVGKSNGGYLSKLIKINSFEREDFIDLLPSFGDYITWMTDEYFWGNKLLFLVFLDIVSAKDNEWPHYATYPHNILRYRGDVLVEFKNYLENLNKEKFTQKNIIDAISAVTGKNHKGFFEFWESYGFRLDPNSILPLDSWDPEERTEEEFVCFLYWSAGTLKTEDYFSGHTQRAEATLDNPDDDGAIAIRVVLHSFETHPPENEAINALSGNNVTFIKSLQFEVKNMYLTVAYFKVTTDDINRKRYNFNITLPSFSSHPKFLAYDYPTDDDIEYGVLYWLHSFDPE